MGAASLECKLTCLPHQSQLEASLPPRCVCVGGGWGGHILHLSLYFFFFLMLPPCHLFQEAFPDFPQLEETFFLRALPALWASLHCISES